MTLVNFGCGQIIHPDWVNFDSVPSVPSVRHCDVRDSLPISDASVDAVYHAHLLEHLDAASGNFFLRECLRVLKPGGILRVVVPDLEGIAKAYLGELVIASRGGDSTGYDWSRMELTDQAARTESGGEMASFIRSLTPAQLAVVRARAGCEVDSILKMRPAGGRWRRFTLGKAWAQSRRELVRMSVWLLGGRQMRMMFDEGAFRQGGEVHRVMYDGFSLARLLTRCGFVEPIKRRADESGIPRFASYELDVVAGVVRKPDSLFMEAVRP